jgi:4-hydroxy-tetrahydrodipicolinate synthase
MASTGVDAVVLVTNRLAAADESAAVWIRTAEKLLDQLPPTLPLGLYECPYPYKRLLSEKLFRWVVESGRFSFLKDTCCDRTIQESRGRIAAGSRLRLFNANSATLLSSISCGYVGYSGVMANFHPELYTGLLGEAPKPELDAFLGVASLVEAHGYPLNAKEYLRRRGLPIEPIVRLGESRLLDAWSAELDKINTLTEHFRPVAKS